MPPGPRRIRSIFPIFPVIALVVGAIGCNRGTSPIPVTVGLLSREPAPGAMGVARGIVLRVTFDEDIDPVSVTPGTCRLEGPLGEVAVALAYDAPAMTLTMSPAQPLARLTSYQVALTNGLRTASGAPFASGHQWTFEVEDAYLWSQRTKVADGRLRELARGVTGTVYAITEASDSTLHISRDDGSGFGQPQPLGVTNAAGVDATDDATGRLVVAVTTYGGELWQVTGTPTTLDPPLLVATSVDTVANVAASASGHTAFGWASLGTGYVLVLLPGQSIGQPYAIGLAYPHVWLDETGAGYAVAAYEHRFPSHQSLEWCQRHCIDALGGITSCDPSPEVPNSYLPGSRATFATNGRALIAIDYYHYNSMKLGYELWSGGFEISTLGAPIGQGQVVGSAAMAIADDGQAVALSHGSPIFNPIGWAGARSVAGAAWQLISLPSGQYLQLNRRMGGYLTNGGPVIAWLFPNLETPGSGDEALFAARAVANSASPAERLDVLQQSEATGEASGLSAAGADEGGVIAWIRDGNTYAVSYR